MWLEYILSMSLIIYMYQELFLAQHIFYPRECFMFFYLRKITLLLECSIDMLGVAGIQCCSNIVFLDLLPSCSIRHWEWGTNVSNYDCWFVSFTLHFCQLLFHVFWGPVKCMYICNCYIYLRDGLILSSLWNIPLYL